jgi:hypothetical protein
MKLLRTSSPNNNKVHFWCAFDHTFFFQLVLYCVSCNIHMRYFICLGQCRRRFVILFSHALCIYLGTLISSLLFRVKTWTRWKQRRIKRGCHTCCKVRMTNLSNLIMMSFVENGLYWYTHPNWTLSCSMHPTILRGHAYMCLLPFIGAGTKRLYISPTDFICYFIVCQDS